ncbi:MAG: SPOR domain-containing protein, partial [Flavobacteriales bacterium]
DKPLARNVFRFEEYATPREEAIPIDAPMPVGVVYKVQVGAFRNELPLEAFSDMTPVAGEHASNGLVRYTAGMFTSAESASEAGKKVRDRGYRDAFVVAYIDGKRVPLREAMQAERAILAQNNTPSATPGVSSSAPTPATTSVSSAVASSGTTSVLTAEPVITTLPQASPGTVVLAEYPATAEEILAAFKPSDRATEYYNDPTAAPAKQVEAVKGLFFTVQVGVYSKPTALDRLFNITPLNSELTANEKIRYTTGIFLDEGKALQRKNGTVALGVTDAFITAYLNGKRIPIRDARALLAKFGREVLVDPGLVTP